jgi:hypothetical protein
MKNVSEIILSKTGYEEILNKLEQLPGTELNSILLELFRRRTERLLPNDIIKEFAKNRFVTPSQLDAIDLKRLELEWLTLAAANNFTPVLLSPLAPLGACSTFKTVDQNNVVSALRGTEAMSDATNVLAFIIAQQYKKLKIKHTLKYVTTARLVRAQGLTHPGHTAHFGIFCMATGGFNTGGFLFEAQQLAEHLNMHILLLSSFDKKNISIKILVKEKNENLIKCVREALQIITTEYSTEIIQQQQPNNYYKLVQFKTYLSYRGNEINLSDGGFVDWTQQLLSNTKHRLLISGIGIELAYKILKGII